MTISAKIYSITSKLVKFGSIGSIFDEWLLKKFPFIWRTRIIHVIWLALIGTVSATALSYWTYNPRSNSVASIFEINVIIQLFLIAGMVVIFIWGLKLKSIPISGVSYSVLLLTVILYVLGSYAILSMPTGFINLATHKIAALELNRSDFYSRFQQLENFNFGYCYKADSQPNRDELEEIFLRDLKPSGYAEFKIEETCSADVTSTIEGVVMTGTCPEESPRCVKLYKADDKAAADTRRLRDRYQSIKAAVNFQDGQESVYNFLGRLWDPARMLLAAACALGLFLLSFASSSPSNARFIISKPSLEWLNIVSWSPAWIRRLDQDLLKNQPNVWAMRTHMLVLFSFIVTGVFSVLVFLYSIKMDLDLDKSNQLVPYFLTLMTFLGFLACYICIAYRLQFPIMLQDWKGAREYIFSFYAPFIPIIIFINWSLIIMLILGNSFDNVIIFGFNFDETKEIAIIMILFMICFCFGQNLAITFYFSMKYFKLMKSGLKLLINIAALVFMLGMLALSFESQEVVDITYLTASIILPLVFFTLKKLPKKHFVSYGALLMWILIFPTVIIVTLEIMSLIASINENETFNHILGALLFFLFIHAMSLGPMFLVRYACRPIHEEILRQAAQPQKG